MDLRDRARTARRCGWIFLACLIRVGSSFGQESQDGVANAPPNIEIVKLKWERQVRLPRNFDPAVIPTNGAFVDPISRSTPPTDTKNNASGGLNPNNGTSLIEFPAPPARMPVFYIYSLKIRNLGAKSLEGIAWDYLFIDSSSNSELGRHQFVSYEKLAADRSVTLKGQLRSPPIRVVRIPDSEKNAHPKFTERAVIQCVLYADNTVWRNPQAREGVCEFLRGGKALLKRKHGAG